MLGTVEAMTMTVVVVVEVEVEVACLPRWYASKPSMIVQGTGAAGEVGEEGGVAWR